MVTIKQKIANKKNYGNSRNVNTIKYITIHYTGNDGDTDERNSTYFSNNIIKASAHYFVDDDSITQSVPDNYIAWSVGGSKYSNCSTTGGGKYYGKCTNTNSISIELCDITKDGKVYPSAKTIANAIELTQSLMKKYNIPKENVIRHFDVNGKSCPAYWCGNATKNKLWLTEFHNKLTTTKSSTKTTTTSTSSTKTTTKATTKTTTTTKKKTDAEIKKDNIKTYQKWLNTNFKTGLTVDGIYGAKTKTASIKAWQTTVNKLYKTKLTVDGKYGANSKTAAKKAIVKNGSKNNLVYILQGMLNSNGYLCDVDGVFGSGTLSQAKAYQKRYKLTVDGVVGANSWNKIFA